jgi:uncharacterized glyoxalase superfamily protein PhnB
MSNAKLFAYLSYRDAVKALDWLHEAFGFEVVTKQLRDDGTVQHAELKLGEAVIMVAGYDQNYDALQLKGRSTGRGLYILTEQLQPIFDSAVKAGATIVFPPEKTEWGSERCRVLDLEGNEWSFGTYQPGQRWAG